MKIKELIQELARFDEDLEVLFYDGEGGYQTNKPTLNEDEFIKYHSDDLNNFFLLKKETYPSPIDEIKKCVSLYSYPYQLKDNE